MHPLHRFDLGHFLHLAHLLTARSSASSFRRNSFAVRSMVRCSVRSVVRSVVWSVDLSALCRVLLSFCLYAVGRSVGRSLFLSLCVLCAVVWLMFSLLLRDEDRRVFVLLSSEDSEKILILVFFHVLPCHLHLLTTRRGNSCLTAVPLWNCGRYLFCVDDILSSTFTTKRGSK